MCDSRDLDVHRIQPDDDPSISFDFGYQPVTEPAAGQRWSTFDEAGVRTGPDPRPDWVITDSAAIDTELGPLKSGKEADVVLIERATSSRSVVLAAKRYRSAEHRQFHRSDSYLEDRKPRNSRDRRAMAKKTKHGRTVAAQRWASAEFETLVKLWSIGVPVPYPVQLEDTEIVMEFITQADGTAAPRLAQTRPSPGLLANYWDQLVHAMTTMTEYGLAHGDLSAFNLLAAGDRLVIIDLPQAVDLIANPHRTAILARDCHNASQWFTARGLEVDADALLAELVSRAW